MNITALCYLTYRWAQELSKAALWCFKFWIWGKKKRAPVWDQCRERESWIGALVWGTMFLMSRRWSSVQPCVFMIIIISIPACVVLCCFSISLLSFMPLSTFYCSRSVKTNNLRKNAYNDTKIQAVIWLRMKYSRGFQTAAAAAAESLFKSTLAANQTHQSPFPPRKQAAFSYQHTSNHAHERP